MTDPKEEKRFDVFLVAGKYDPVSQEPSNPRLIMGESDLRLLCTQKPGIQYVPKRWLQHENMKHDLPHLVLRGNILGLIVPTGELISMNGIREEIVLLGSLPGACSGCRRYPRLIEANKKFDEAWESLEAAYAELMNQLEATKKKENSLR